MTEYDLLENLPANAQEGHDRRHHRARRLSASGEVHLHPRPRSSTAEEMILAGCQDIEVTNLGNPFVMPQFRDAEQVLAHLRSDRFREALRRAGHQHRRRHLHRRDHPRAGRGPGDRAAQEGHRPGPAADDGVDRRGAPLRQFRLHRCRSTGRRASAPSRSATTPA